MKEVKSKYDTIRITYVTLGFFRFSMSFATFEEA